MIPSFVIIILIVLFIVVPWIIQWVMTIQNAHRVEALEQQVQRLHEQFDAISRVKIEMTPLARDGDTRGGNSPGAGRT